MEIGFKELVDVLSVVCRGEEKESVACVEAEPDHPYEVGKCYFVRCVTMYYVGRMVRVTSQELVMTDVSWVVDTGRFSGSLRTGLLSELVPFPVGEVIVGRGTVIEASEWNHELSEKENE